MAMVLFPFTQVRWEVHPGTSLMVLMLVMGRILMVCGSNSSTA